MFLNMSSAPRLVVSSLTPKDLSSGSAGGGGPFFSCRGAGFEIACPFTFGVWFSFPSGTDPIANVLFLLLNQLPLFFLLRLGLLSTVAGDPGRSELRLSDDDRVRRPRNLRTDPGRLLVGLVGDSVLLAASNEVVGRRTESAADSVVLRFLCCGKTPEIGVGCDDRGPLPGVGGRGVSGGESSGAGMEVPSVREKLTGVRVRGW